MLQLFLQEWRSFGEREERCNDFPAASLVLASWIVMMVSMYVSMMFLFRLLFVNLMSL